MADTGHPSTDLKLMMTSTCKTSDKKSPVYPPRYASSDCIIYCAGSLAGRQQIARARFLNHPPCCILGRYNFKNMNHKKGGKFSRTLCASTVKEIMFRIFVVIAEIK